MNDILLYNLVWVDDHVMGIILYRVDTCVNWLL
jgi:hypothetical protein